MGISDTRIAQLEDELRILTGEFEREKALTKALQERLQTFDNIADGRKNVLINVLQIMRTEKELTKAIEQSIIETGRFTNISRVHVFEKDYEKNVLNCNYEWCNEGIEPVIDTLKNISMEFAGRWFEHFENYKFVRVNNVQEEFEPEMAEFLGKQSIKSLIAFPLTVRDEHYGLIGFDECTYCKEWCDEDIDLIKSLSQIISSALQRDQAEKDLLELNRRQDIIIRVLQIIQSAESLPQAIDVSLAEIGKHAGVSRVYVFEKSAEGQFIACTHEWRSEGIEPSQKNRPFEAVKHAFEIFDAGKFICTADFSSFPTEIIKSLEQQNIKSLLIMPLTSYGEHYGFIGFDECVFERKWNKKEVELLKSLSQIISTAAQRKNTETSLHLSQQSMKTVLNSIDANITVYDLNKSTILFANKKTKKSFGDDIEGKICWQTMHAGMTGICPFCPRQYIFDEKNKPAGVYRWEYRNDFDNKWYECSDVAIEWVDGQIVHLQLELDVNDRKLAELELVKAKEKAEEADNLKSTFLANMSHEIRTPLNAIVGLLQFIEADSLSPEYREIVADMNSSAKHLSQLIDDIIDISRIEAKLMRIVPVSMRLNELMHEMHQFFHSVLLSKDKSHISLILDDSQFIDDCVVMTDSFRLRQVLINLLGNAAKFTDKGFIRFSYRRSSPEFLEFVVEDSGVGLPANQQSVIFERFKQSEGSASHHGGSGLGLTISRNLVQLMGGDMWVNSTEGIGSKFYFTIPYIVG